MGGDIDIYGSSFPSYVWQVSITHAPPGIRSRFAVFRGLEPVARLQEKGGMFMSFAYN